MARIDSGLPGGGPAAAHMALGFDCPTRDPLDRPDLDFPQNKIRIARQTEGPLPDFPKNPAWDPAGVYGYGKAQGAQEGAMR